MKMDDQDQRIFDEPQKLRDALRELEKERLLVPATLDEAMVRAAQEHLGLMKDAELEESSPVPVEMLVFHRKLKPVKIDPRVRRWHKWLPLAASITIAATIFYFARTGSALAGDLNRDGAVDVIDAMLLAERVERGEPMARNADVNNDARIDARDSDEILTRAVDLERGGS